MSSCVLIRHLPSQSHINKFIAISFFSSFAEGERFAKANDLLFLEASAKTGDYVEETMVTAAINVLERLNNGLFRMDDEVSVLEFSHV